MQDIMTHVPECREIMCRIYKTLVEEVHFVDRHDICLRFQNFSVSLLPTTSSSQPLPLCEPNLFLYVPVIDLRLENL
jgi:hypothetical protein